MAKPVLLTIDDDPEVLRAIARDLQRQYGATYRVVRAPSGAIALDTLRQLKLRNDPVALLLSDQRMPEMSGVEFLERAMEIYPDAKRALLTAYADTSAAISAINTVRVDYYMLKPWDPPEERLYPVIDELLADWQAGYRPIFEGIRVIGHRWSAASHSVKDFLARNGVPYLWLDIETSEEATRLVAQAGGDPGSLPLLLFQDGTSLAEPTNAQIADKVGLRTRAELPFYDLVIVGGGPAGLAAAVYGASEGLSTVLVEGSAPGGQAGTSSRIENYLGFPAGLSGADLARRGVAQATRFGVEILTPQEATGVRVDGPVRYVNLADGTEIGCRALLVATGVSYRTLSVPGVERLTGAGVYYGAAISEAMSCKGEDAYIVGGANSAGQAAMYFSKFARKVTILVRGPSLAAGMSQYLVDEIGNTPNIVVRTCSEVVEAHGDERLESLTISNSTTGERETVPASTMFIFIGAAPCTNWLAGVVERDPQGFICSGTEVMENGKRPQGWAEDRDPYLLETSVPGIFVAGDVRRQSVKRCASAVGEGSMAVMFIHQHLATV